MKEGGIEGEGQTGEEAEGMWGLGGVGRKKEERQEGGGGGRKKDIEEVKIKGGEMNVGERKEDRIKD